MTALLQSRSLAVIVTILIYMPDLPYGVGHMDMSIFWKSKSPLLKRHFVMSVEKHRCIIIKWASQVLESTSACVKEVVSKPFWLLRELPLESVSFGAEDNKFEVWKWYKSGFVELEVNFPRLRSRQPHVCLRREAPGNISYYVCNTFQKLCCLMLCWWWQLYLAWIHSSHCIIDSWLRVTAKNMLKSFQTTAATWLLLHWIFSPCCFSVKFIWADEKNSFSDLKVQSKRYCCVFVHTCDQKG